MSYFSLPFSNDPTSVSDASWSALNRVVRPDIGRTSGIRDRRSAWEEETRGVVVVSEEGPFRPFNPRTRETLLEVPG